MLVQVDLSLFSLVGEILVKLFLPTWLSLVQYKPDYFDINLCPISSCRDWVALLCSFDGPSNSPVLTTFVILLFQKTPML